MQISLRLWLQYLMCFSPPMSQLRNTAVITALKYKNQDGIERKEQIDRQQAELEKFRADIELWKQLINKG